MKTAKTISCLLTVLAVGLFLITQSGCESAAGTGGGTTDGGGTTNDGGTDGGDTDGGGTNGDGTDGGETDDGSTLPALVKTRISLQFDGIADPSGKIQAGDDLVVYGLPNKGVFCFVASHANSDTSSASVIPNSAALFGFRNFVVAGKKVALVGSTNAVSIFDTVDSTQVDIPGTQITLAPLPIDANEPGHMVSDGDLIATINEVGEFAANPVDDGNPIKVIDVSGSEPVVISFPNPLEFARFDQVAVDAGSRRVAAVGGGDIYVFDIDNPASAPRMFDFGLGSSLGLVSNEVQIRIDGDWILFHDSSDFDPRVSLLNVTDGTVTHFNNNPTQRDAPVALAGGSFAYFQFREVADAIFSADTVYRSAIGRVDDAPNSTLAGQLDAIGSDTPDCVDGGIAGYGSTLAVTPDGSRWFLAGEGPVGRVMEHLQMSTGGAFEPFEDTEGDTQTGTVMATDVSASSNTVAFRALRQVPGAGCMTIDDWVIGFIILDRLEP
ncbi:MAG: hypothetical protein IID43_01200 [Planctomycetes bacterium]|nr:hypothetical protein [Planctomycetota bacterium]